MGTQAEREGVREAFRKLFLADREKGLVRDLDHYKNLFPGFWDVVGGEYHALHGDGAPGAEGGAGTPGTSAPVTMWGPGAGTDAGRIGPYRVLKELGRGGMGVVYLAEDTRLGRKVALKVLPAHFASSRPLLLRFEREAELASKLDHPNICAVYEAGESEGTAYMAMRLLDGKPLAEWIGLSREKGRPSGFVILPPLEEQAPDAKAATGEPKEDLDRILRLIEKAARAIHVAHEKGLIHRDIKPHNIMVTAEGEPVLLDFGLAREEEGEGQGLTRTGSLMGTPAYLSPEQLAAQRIRVDRRTDVYSLGVTLYECLTLRLPFEAPTLDGLYQKILMTEPEAPRRLNVAIPKDLQVVVATAIERDRERRYRTALDLAEDIRRVREYEPISARPAGPLLRAQRWVQRNPVLAAFGATLAAGLCSSLWLLEVARTERDEKQVALADRSRALDERGAALLRARVVGLVAASSASHQEDPMRSLLLARAAALLSPGPEAGARLQEELRASRERRIDRRGPRIGKQEDRAFFFAGGTRILCGREIYDREGARVAELPPGTTLPRPALPAVASSRRILVLETDEKTKAVTTCIRDEEGRTIAALGDPNRKIWDGVLMPGGEEVLLYLDDQTLSLRDLANRERTRYPPLPVEDPWARGYCVAADGSRVLRVQGPRAFVLDLDGKEVGVLQQPEGWHFKYWCFSPDGGRILSVDGDAAQHYAVSLWSPDGRHLRTVDTADTRITNPTFCSDGLSFLFFKQGSGSIVVCNADGAVRAEFKASTIQATQLEFSPDGNRILAALGTASMARVWDLDGRELATLRGSEGFVSGATFSPDGESVLTTSWFAPARLWELRDRDLPSITASGGFKNANMLSLSPRGDRFATAGLGGAFVGPRVYDMAGSLVADHGVPNSWWVRFSPSGDAMVVLGETCRLVTPDGRLIADLKGVESAAFSRDGRTIATASADGVFLRDGSGTVIRRLEGGASSGSLEFAADGNSILQTGGIDRQGNQTEAHLWDIQGHPLMARGRADWPVMALSPKGDRILAGSTKEAALLDPSGTPVLRFGGDTGGIEAVAFAPDGTAVLTGSRDGKARLWDLEGKLLAVLPGRGSPIDGLKFSMDGSRIATWSQNFLAQSVDTTVRLWDRKGRLIALFPHESPVVAVEFSPDGRKLLTGAFSGIARVWMCEIGDLLALAERRVTRHLTPGERSMYADLLEPVEGAAR